MRFGVDSHAGDPIMVWVSELRAEGQTVGGVHLTHCFPAGKWHDGRDAVVWVPREAPPFANSDVQAASQFGVSAVRSDGTELLVSAGVLVNGELFTDGVEEFSAEGLPAAVQGAGSARTYSPAATAASRGQAAWKGGAHLPPRHVCIPGAVENDTGSASNE